MTRLTLLSALSGMALATALLAAACGEESGSAQCPADDLELYNLRDGGTMDPDVAARLAEAGCITLPSPPGPGPGSQQVPAAAGAGGN